MSDYDDIINLPHYVSKKRKQMSMIDRAAQFSPFMALVGFDGEVKESQRLTDKRIELSEGDKEILNEKLLMIEENLENKPEIRVTYFVADGRKEGGAYISASGRVKKIDEYNKKIVLTDGREIKMADITDILL